MYFLIILITISNTYIKNWNINDYTEAKINIPIFHISDLCIFQITFSYLSILTINEATEVKMPINENHIVVLLPIAEFFDLTELGST